MFIGRTDAEAEVSIFWPPDVKNWLTGKDPDAGKDWRWEEKGTTEDEMVGWHHWLNRHEFEQVPGVGDGQGGLACSSPWSHKESDTTEWVNWLTELSAPSRFCSYIFFSNITCPSSTKLHSSYSIIFTLLFFFFHRRYLFNKQFCGSYSQPGILAR